MEEVSASLNLLTASFECHLFPPDFNLKEVFSPPGLKGVLNFFLLYIIFSLISQ